MSGLKCPSNHVLAGLLLLISLASPAFPGSTAIAATSGSRNGVLIELFTSEGCSDCPPADALLERLDRSQPVQGAEVIVLSEHVDYWNSIGWTDPFSSRAISERQSAYSRRFGLDSVYTPQMVVDGTTQFVGSDERAALQAIAEAVTTEKAPVKLSLARFLSDNSVAFHIDIAQLPPSLASQSLNVLLAVADENAESHVKSGENGGRTLKHVAVVQNLVRLGSIGGDRSMSQDFTINIHKGSANLRLVAFIQQAQTWKVLGVGSIRLSR